MKKPAPAPTTFRPVGTSETIYQLSYPTTNTIQTRKSLDLAYLQNFVTTHNLTDYEIILIQQTVIQNPEGTLNP